MKIYKCYGCKSLGDFDDGGLRFIASDKKPEGFEIVEDMTRELLTTENIGAFLQDILRTDAAMQCFVDALLHKEQRKLTRRRKLKTESAAVYGKSVYKED